MNPDPSFHAKVEMSHAQIQANETQSRTLATLRDTLLRELLDEMDPMDTSKKPSQR